ncbi:MAG: glycosyltransferase [Acidobacteriota bacterium]
MGGGAAPCDSVHLNTELGFRGGEVQNLGLVRHLEGAGLPCILVAHARGPLLAKARAEGLRTVAWHPRGELDPFAVWQLRRLLREARPRILHAHTAHALTLALLAARGLPGLNLVASRRVSFPLRTPLSRWKYSRPRAVVAVSGEVGEELIRGGLSEERVRIIHSGVDLARFRALPLKEEVRQSLGLPVAAEVVGVVGALVPHKGHRVLLEALGAWPAGEGKPALLLVGEGPLKRELASAAKRMGVTTTFLGYVEEPAPLYGALDALVLPSLSGEGSPGVIKEAAAAGVPVVATDVGGTAEILRPDREALLVPPGDPTSMRDALARVFREPGLGESLRESARRRVQDFSMEAMGRAHERLYEELTSARP